MATELRTNSSAPQQIEAQTGESGVVGENNEMRDFVQMVHFIREKLRRRLDRLAYCLFEERQARDSAELTAGVLEDRAEFIRDNAAAIISHLRDRVNAVESQTGEQQPTLDRNVPETAEELRQRLQVREEQLERITRQLDATNRLALKQQTEIADMSQIIVRSRCHCIDLQIELNRERRLTRDLETRLWQLSRKLSASGPMPPHVLSSLQQKEDMMAELRMELEAMSYSLSQIEALRQRPPPS